RGGDGLCRSRLHSQVEKDTLWKLRVAEEIELVTNVAVRWSVVEAQIVEVERPIGKRVAFVRVVVFIFRQPVVGLELIFLRKTLPHAECAAPIQRVTETVRDEHIAELRLEWIGANVSRRVPRGRL